MSGPTERGHTGTLLAGAAFGLPLLCCIGLTVLIAAGLGIGLALVVIGGAVAGVVATMGVVLILLALRRRRATGAGNPPRGVAAPIVDERTR